MLNKLIKIANQLDQKGFYQEANAIDLLLKQAIEEGPEYYGFKPEEKSKVMDLPESGIMTPEQYKRYYGYEMEKSKGPEEKKEVEEQKQPEKPHEDKYDEFIKWLKNLRKDRINNFGELDAMTISASNKRISITFYNSINVAHRIIIDKELGTSINILGYKKADKLDDQDYVLEFDLSANPEETSKALSLIDEYLLETLPGKCQCGEWLDDRGRCLSGDCKFDV